MAEDDLSDLTAAWDAATPRPDPALRAAHLRLAQENFARLHAAQPAPAAPPRWFRAWFETLTGRGGLTAATALAACGFLVLTPDGQEIWRGAPVETGPGFTDAASTKQAPAGGLAPEDSAPGEAATADGDMAPDEVQPAPEVAPSAPEAAPAEAGPVLNRQAPVPSESAQDLSAEETPDLSAAMTAPAGEPSAAATDQPSARLAQPEPLSRSPIHSADSPEPPTPEAATMAAPAGEASGSATDRAAGAVASGAPEARLAPPPGAMAQVAPDDAADRAGEPPPREESGGAEVDTMSAPSEVTGAPPTPAPPVDDAETALAEEATTALAPPSANAARDSLDEVREALQSGRRPSPDMVRIGELVAAVLPEAPPFGPQDGAVPPGLSVQPAPWADGASLVIVTAGRAGPGMEGLTTELTWDPAVVQATPLDAAPDGGPSLYEVRPRAGATGPWGMLRLLWTDDGVARASEVPILGTEAPGPDARLAAAVAGWALLLRGELDPETWSYEDAARLAEENPNETALAAEAPDLIRLSARISP